MAYDDSIKREARKRGLKGGTMIDRMNDVSAAQMHSLSGGLLYPQEGPKATQRALNRGDLRGPNSPRQPSAFGLLRGSSGRNNPRGAKGAR